MQIVSTKDSLREMTICVKCQNLFSEKKEKYLKMIFTKSAKC